jgi:hypothetical protein
VAAQIVPNPLDWIESRAVGRQLQQSDIAAHYETSTPVPGGTIEDHHGMRIGGDLAADLAEVMVHCGGIADRHGSAGLGACEQRAIRPNRRRHDEAI